MSRIPGWGVLRWRLEEGFVPGKDVGAEQGAEEAAGGEEGAERKAGGKVGSVTGEEDGGEGYFRQGFG